MPALLTYPGVYVEEISSGVRSITGVATSITAFLGRALKGPTEPTLINSFSDFHRIFGGLWALSPLGYAVNDFYLNGGGQAIIVRLYHPNDDHDKKTKAIITVNCSQESQSLQLEAANEGSWANSLKVRITYPNEAVAKETIKSQGLDKYSITETDLFNLTIRNIETGEAETFQNLTVKDSPRRVTEVLKNESKLLRTASDLPNEIPAKHADAPDKNKSIWDENIPETSIGVIDASKAFDGDDLDASDYTKDSAGMDLLNKVDIFNLLCIPLEASFSENNYVAIYQKAMKLCADRRAMLIVDPPNGFSADKLGDLGLTGPAARNAAFYFPRIVKEDPLRGRQQRIFAPSGAIAGVIARTDSQRGVWKAPAGVDAAITGITGLEVNLNDAENGSLNPLGINCLRSFPVYGCIVWGARTLRGSDQLGDEYKYIPVRRMALYIEESLFRGLKWVVFEPNNESLWAQIRLNVGAFMHNLFRQGAFQGTTPQKAYFVKCDKETTTQDDINKGIVNVIVGFAPLKPAEFVVIKIQQMAGDIQV